MGQDPTNQRLGVAPRIDTQTGHSTLGLPEDLLDYSLKRLGWLALIIGIAIGLNTLANALMTLGGAMPLPPLSLLLRLGICAGCAGVWWVVRSPRFSSQQKVTIGLIFEVVGAFAFALFEVTVFRDFGLPMGGTTSFVCVWILIFRLIVPTTSTRALITALLSASGVPLAIWLSAKLGYPSFPSLVVAGLYKTSYMTAIIAWLASRSIYRLGTAVSEARMMGRYKLERLLGSGGMGEVWLASHALLKRPAAIKLISPEALGLPNTEETERQLRRFEREAQATAELHSPNTVRLYDFGTTEGGSFYYVMEYLEGIDLDTLVERYGPVQPERAVFILRQICHSLMDAHEQGMIHRDIKPSNVRLCHLGPDFDFVKVLDFGLVKHLSVEPQELDLTREGAAAGTPAYMAPEVALGHRDIGAATDLYMVGCVAYWLLTGQLVFEGATPMAVVSGHIHSEPPPLSQRTELSVPPELEQLIMDCLRKDPTERPSSAEALFEGLDAVPLANAWSKDRARKWWQIHTQEMDAADANR
jgi:eukaryotic-like serine/threonine-protein kinase